MNFWSKHLFFSLRTVGSQERRTVKVHFQNVNFHLLRHTYATVCIENGFDAKTVSELLGHSNVNITISVPNSNTKPHAVPTDKNNHYNNE